MAARKLLRRAGRDRAGRFLVEGAQAVREALAVATVHELFVTATAADRHPELVAAARQNGMTYNRFIQGLKIAGVEVDRKILAELAVSEPAAFAALVDVARANVPASGVSSVRSQDGTAA